MSNIQLSDIDIQRMSYIDTEFNPKPIIKNELSKDDIKILHNLEKQNKLTYNDNYVSEFLKCRSNPLYFIHNYCNISEVGTPRLYTKDMMNKKYRRLIKCLYKYHKCLLMASRQLGKALDLNTIIPTPNGFKRLEELSVGDYVYSEFGKPIKIIAESEVFYDKKCYKILFDNNEEVIASEDHLWKIYNHKNIYTTKDLYNLYNIDYEIRIELPKEIFLFNNKKIDKRVEIINKIYKKYGSKFCEKNNEFQLKSNNIKLLKIIQSILSSLGIKNTLYNDYIIFKTNNLKFNFVRNRYNDIDFKTVRVISIEEYQSIPCKCLVVNSPTKLFLVGNTMIPTHNSTIAACLLAHAITFYPGIRACIFNMDMGAGCENIAKVKFILENLPDWMRFVPRRVTSKTFIDLSNDSKISVFYPSTIKSPEQLSRSLTIPVLYVDNIYALSTIKK